MAINHFWAQFLSSDLFDWNIEFTKNDVIMAKMAK